MTEIIGVRFKEAGKTYYFSPKEEKFNIGDKVIVETARALELGEVVTENKMVEESEIVSPLKEITRKATNEDNENYKKNKAKEKEAFKICQKKITEHKLDMKLVDAEFTFDGNKVLFYFTSDGRVDFRDLVKDLASIFKVRIELRQIGVRDEAKILGGLGVCGRKFCCSSFLGDFQPVSIKMAKEQNMSLNPVKISGICGRLMCCLKYEEEAYNDLLRSTPRRGDIVKSPDGEGMVVDVNLLRGNIKVKLSSLSQDAAPKVYNKKDLKVIKAAVYDDDENLDSLKELE